MYLSDIKELEVALKREQFSKIKLLHKLIFDNEGDRSNRKRLRSFPGFEFATDSHEFSEKINKIKNTFSFNDLITICNILNIDNNGNFDELNTRIISYLCDLTVLKDNIISNDDDDDDDNDLAENEDPLLNETSKVGNSINGNNEQHKSNNYNKVCSEMSSVQIRDDSGSTSYENMQPPVREIIYKNNVNFSDLENMIINFNGDQTQSIDSWLKNFEDIANLFELSNLQKLIFARRCLSGRAKLFIESELSINSFEKLKEILIDEFGSSYNSAEMHELLTKRKMKYTETVDEYFLIMKQICSRGNIDDLALMQYVINGINDSTIKKQCLYGCQNLFEFKQKLKVYEKIRSDSEISKFEKSKSNSKPEMKRENSKYNSKPIRKSVESDKQRKTDIKCFNCGLPNHRSVECRFKDQGPRCFRCSQYGHKSFECTESQDSAKPHQTAHVNVINSQNVILKDVYLCSARLTALIDTGSQKTLLRKSAFDRFQNSVQLRDSAVSLFGLGQTSVKPLGHFHSNILIDDSIFPTDIFVVHDRFVTFDLIIGTDVIRQGTLTVTADGTTLCKADTDPEKFLINLVDVVEEFPIDLPSATAKNSSITQAVSINDPFTLPLVPTTETHTLSDVLLPVASSTVTSYKTRRTVSNTKLLKTCEEMEKYIKTLEKEKEELETEAEEMASLLRNQTSSDELLETSMRLAQSTKQLENLREENSCLKSTLQRYESFMKESSLSISMSKVTELSQENASLLAEINTLKSQQKIDNRNHTNSSVELSNFKSSENLEEILKKVITLLIETVKKIQCNSDIEKTSEYELLTVKSKDYEAKIDNLSSTINTLTSHLEELNKKVAGLEKANSLLNTTLENVEEELQNTYSEKQKLEENIQEKIDEIERLQQKVSLTNDKKTNEANTVSNLQMTIKELKECLQINEKKLTELQNKNHKLQNEISCSTKQIKDLKVSIIEKDCCIQKNNSTFQRSINTTPFELLFGTKMNIVNNTKISDLLNAELQSEFIQTREELRREAKKQILKVQAENRKTYNLRRRQAKKFQINDVVAIKRTHQGSGLKLKPKFLGPYKVVKVKPHDTYDVQKIGYVEGPMYTSTCAQYMKPWPDNT